MKENKSWLKFIITGNPKDYLNYKQIVKQHEMLGGEGSAHYNRWPCNQGNEYKG